MQDGDHRGDRAGSDVSGSCPDAVCREQPTFTAAWAAGNVMAPALDEAIDVAMHSAIDLAHIEPGLIVILPTSGPFPQM